MKRQAISILIAIIILLSAKCVIAQTDSLPTEDALKAAGIPVTDELRKNMRIMDSLMGGIAHLEDTMMSGMRAQWARNKEASLHAVEEPGTLASLEIQLRNPEILTVLLIDLAKEPIDKLPDEFTGLTELRVLVIANLPVGRVFDFEDALEKLGQLHVEELYIINNRGAMTTLPRSIGKDTSLKILALYNNALKRIPDEVCTIAGLEELSLGMTEITSLPKTINRLDQLRALDLRKTRIAGSDLAAIRGALKSCAIKSDQ